jgi:hypothetical protein
MDLRLEMVGEAYGEIAHFSLVQLLQGQQGSTAIRRLLPLPSRDDACIQVVFLCSALGLDIA